MSAEEHEKSEWVEWLAIVVGVGLMLYAILGRRVDWGQP